MMRTVIYFHGVHDYVCVDHLDRLWTAKGPWVKDIDLCENDDATCMYCFQSIPATESKDG